MLERAEAECRRLGVERLILGTSELQREAIAFYRAAGYLLVREDIAAMETNKTIAGLRRFHFEKRLGAK